MPNLECPHFVESESSTWAVKFDNLVPRISRNSNHWALKHTCQRAIKKAGPDRIGSDRIDKNQAGSEQINKTWIGLHPINKTRTGAEKNYHNIHVTAHDQVLAKKYDYIFSQLSEAKLGSFS